MKRAVAEVALKEVCKKFEEKLNTSTAQQPFVFGLGTGSTIAEFWPLFADYLERKNIQHIVIVPTSYQSRDLVLNSRKKYSLVGLDQYPEVECLVDGFDEVELAGGSMIKGGGAAHTIEKLVALSSSHTIYIGTSDKISPKLGENNIPIPIEVIPPAFPLALQHLQGKAGYCVLRQSKGGGKIGPIVTDLGNFILDWFLPTAHLLWDDLELLEKQIQGLPGVIGCGLFFNLTSTLLTTDKNGVVSIHIYDNKKP